MYQIYNEILVTPNIVGRTGYKKSERNMEDYKKFLISEKSMLDFMVDIGIIDSYTRSDYSPDIPETDTNMICRMCKSKDTSVIINPVELQPFKEWYSTFHNLDFKAVKCNHCGSVHSFYWRR